MSARRLRQYASTKSWFQRTRQVIQAQCSVLQCASADCLFLCDQVWKSNASPDSPSSRRAEPSPLTFLRPSFPSSHTLLCLHHPLPLIHGVHTHLIARDKCCIRGYEAHACHATNSVAMKRTLASVARMSVPALEEAPVVVDAGAAAVLLPPPPPPLPLPLVVPRG